jgi:MFS family permease
MDQASVKRNIKLFALFKILRDPMLWGPVLITYIMNVGKMELSEIYLMEAVVVFMMIFVEIYTSAWADLLGRKLMLVLGGLQLIAGVIIFGIADSPLHIWLSNIILMFGFAFVSGVDEAFLYDTLKSAGRTNEYTKISGRIMSWRFFLIAVSAIASGYLYTIHPRLPVLLSLPTMLTALLATLFLKEPRQTSKAGHKEHFKLMKLSILFTLNHRKVKWIIAYIVIIMTASKLWFFTYNPYFELVELKPVYFGWIFFCLNIVAWFSSRFAHRIEAKLSEPVIIIGLVLIESIPILLMGLFVFKLSALLVMFENLCRGFREPFFSGLINRHLDSKNRATVLSIKSAVRAFVNSISLLLFGLVLDIVTLHTAMIILGSVVLLMGAISIRYYFPIFKEK